MCLKIRCFIYFTLQYVRLLNVYDIVYLWHTQTYLYKAINNSVRLKLWTHLIFLSHSDHALVCICVCMYVSMIRPDLIGLKFYTLSIPTCTQCQSSTQCVMFISCCIIFLVLFLFCSRLHMG